MPTGGKATAQLDLTNDLNEPFRHGITALFWSLWVDEEYRRKGYATELLALAEDLARKEGHKKISLEWSEEEAGMFVHDFYTRRGFGERMFGRGTALMEKNL